MFVCFAFTHDKHLWIGGKPNRSAVTLLCNSWLEALTLGKWKLQFCKLVIVAIPPFRGYGHLWRAFHSSKSALSQKKKYFSLVSNIAIDRYCAVFCSNVIISKSNVAGPTSTRSAVGRVYRLPYTLVGRSHENWCICTFLGLVRKKKLSLKNRARLVVVLQLSPFHFSLAGLWYRTHIISVWKTHVFLIKIGVLSALRNLHGIEWHVRLVDLLLLV